MNSFIKYNVVSLLWALLILILCLLPGKDIPSLQIFEFDKLVHFLIYLLLALLMYYGWVKQKSYASLHRNTLVKILIITFIYGFAVEVIQELCTADRHFDIYDALANAAGAVAGSFLCIYLKPRLTL